MAKTIARITKKCVKCGHVTKVMPRRRHCQQRQFGPRSYCCWGVLQPVRKTALSPTTVSVEVANQKYCEAVRKKGAAAHARAVAFHRSWQRELARIQKLVDKWARLAQRHYDRAHERDEAILARRQRARMANQVRVATLKLKKAAGL